MSDPRDRESAGRLADAAELRTRLPQADRDYLAGAAANPALTEELAVAIAKNPASDERVLQRIADEPKWSKSYRVKRSIVRHAKTPHALAMNLTKFLFWRDLHEVAENHFIYPPLRKVAEKYLLERLPSMALGEKMSLGRIAGRAAMLRLLGDKNPLVVEAVLWNVKLTGQEVLVAVQDQRTTPEVLSLVARHPRWIARAEIRSALARNSRTPLAVSLGLLNGLTTRDLTALVEDLKAPAAVKAAARRVLGRSAQKRGKPVR